MIGVAFSQFFAALVSLVNSFGAYVPGDTKDSTLFFHITPDHHVAVADLDGSKKVMRSDTRLWSVPDGASFVRATRGSDGIYIVVGCFRFCTDDTVTLFRLSAANQVSAPIEIGHGTAPEVVARRDSKYVVVSFFEARPANETTKGLKAAPPTHVLHVQVRNVGSLTLEGSRMLRGRDGSLLDDGVLMAPLSVPKCIRMTTGDRVAIDLPARLNRRRVAAKLPLLQIVDDRDGAMFGDLESDADSSVMYVSGESDEP